MISCHCSPVAHLQHDGRRAALSAHCHLTTRPLPPPGGSPEQHQHGHEKRLKVTVPVDVSVVVHGHFPEGLQEETAGLVFALEDKSTHYK